MDEICIIREEDVPEFFGQIVDVFEDFLDEKGINIMNAEKDDSINPANIYGSDYDLVVGELELIMKRWGITARTQQQ